MTKPYRVDVAPHLAIIVDDSLCIVLDTRAGRHTITNVDAFCSALQGARDHVKVEEAAAMNAYADALDRWRADTDDDNPHGPRFNTHNRDSGAWCPWSTCTVVEKPDVPDADRRCPDLCTASQVVRAE